MASSSQRLTAEERAQLQQLLARAEAERVNLEVIADWDLTDEEAGMSDASKRRMTEYVPPAWNTRGNPYAAPSVAAAAAPVNTPGPLSTPVSSTPAAQEIIENSVTYGCTKKGTPITLPPGVSDLEAWGSTVLKFGKLAERDLTYHQVSTSTDEVVKRYVKWVKAQADASDGLMKDLSFYLLAHAYDQGETGQMPLIPGTTTARVYRRS